MKPILPLLLLVLVGALLEVSGVIQWQVVVDRARNFAGWPLALGIVIGQVLLYAFAQPGSALFWVAALLYSPLIATLILTTGGTAGAVAAYWVARRATRKAYAGGSPPPLYAAVAGHGDFFALCALRMLPGMPHALINYASGTLRVPLARFIAATVPGLALKSFVYASVVDRIAEAASPADLFHVDVLAPLLGGVLLLVLARFVWRRHRAGLRSGS